MGQIFFTDSQTYMRKYHIVLTEKFQNISLKYIILDVLYKDYVCVKSSLEPYQNYSVFFVDSEVNQV
jgi:hypothetical protein